MGWQTDDEKHEGWLAPTFADGGLGSGYFSEGVLVARIGEQELEVEQWQYRPDDDVIGWLTVCECGWRGQPWTRVREAGEQDLAVRKVYSFDSFAPTPVDDAAHAEW